jgi:hypothetical protein
MSPDIARNRLSPDRRGPHVSVVAASGDARDFTHRVDTESALPLHHSRDGLEDATTPILVLHWR